ncbi:unnamed protein product, partial [Brugia timori]|uniref:Ovule protein n=1 Tax=Brugia timori TaxID=42155 RepID=A0A0R3QHK7_9BILA
LFSSSTLRFCNFLISSRLISSLNNNNSLLFTNPFRNNRSDTDSIFPVTELYKQLILYGTNFISS